MLPIVIIVVALLQVVFLMVEEVRVRQQVEEVRVRQAVVHVVVEDKDLKYSTNKNYQYI